LRSEWQAPHSCSSVTGIFAIFVSSLCRVLFHASNWSWWQGWQTEEGGTASGGLNDSMGWDIHVPAQPAKKTITMNITMIDLFMGSSCARDTDGSKITSPTLSVKRR
jgi:hypothetical protein